jgi:hypothetical protein
MSTTPHDVRLVFHEKTLTYKTGMLTVKGGVLLSIAPLAFLGNEVPLIVRGVVGLVGVLGTDGRWRLFPLNELQTAKGSRIRDTSEQDIISAIQRTAPARLCDVAL